MKAHSRVETVVSKEGGHLSRLVHSVVDCKLCHAKPLFPVLLSEVDVLPEVLLEELVSVFRLAVRFWVPSGRKSLLDT